MKRFKFITVVLFSALISIFSSCRENENNDVLTRGYSGVLSVEYTMGFPAYTSKTGQSIKETVPDIEGTFTYGYNLTLITIPG